MFLLSPEADMRPGNLQAQVQRKNAFWFADREARGHDEGISGEWGPFRTATPAHCSHTGYCGIARKRRFLTRRQLVNRATILFGPAGCPDSPVLRFYNDLHQPRGPQCSQGEIDIDPGLAALLKQHIGVKKAGRVFVKHGTALQSQATTFSSVCCIHFLRS